MLKSYKTLFVAMQRNGKYIRSVLLYNIQIEFSIVFSEKINGTFTCNKAKSTCLSITSMPSECKINYDTNVIQPSS